MTLQEVVPHATAHELNPQSKYLIFVNPSIINEEGVQLLRDQLAALEIDAAIIFAALPSAAVQMLEVKP